MIEPLRGRNSFQRLQYEGTRVRSGLLSVTMLPAAAEGARSPQVAYAIGRHVGNAVVRNRLRRQLRALMRARAEALAPGAYLVACSPRARGSSSTELARDLDRAMAKLSLTSTAGR